MTLGQIIALMMVNKCVRFQTKSFNNEDVMTKVKVFHAYANDANDDANDKNRCHAADRIALFEP